MSLQFSNTTLKSGIIQRIESACGFNDGDITASPIRFAKMVAAINSAHDDALAFIFKAAGWKWQADDINHTGFPSATINLVSGTKEYAFTTDSEGSLILDIYKVMVKDAAVNGKYIELDPVDIQSDIYMQEFNDGQVRSGIPSKYDKTGNRITFNITPDYSVTAGIKLLINREGTYFTIADTTKMPGIAGPFHDWYVLKPSYEYARSKNLPNLNTLKRDMDEMQAKIEGYYGARNKDDQKKNGGLKGIEKAFR